MHLEIIAYLICEFQFFLHFTFLHFTPFFDSHTNIVIKSARLVVKKANRSVRNQDAQRQMVNPFSATPMQCFSANNLQFPQQQIAPQIPQQQILNQTNSSQLYDQMKVNYEQPIAQMNGYSDPTSHPMAPCT